MKTTTQRQQKDIKVRVIKKSILPVGNLAVVRDTGNGFFLIIKAQTHQGKLLSTEPMTLWLRAGEFEVVK